MLNSPETPHRKDRRIHPRYGIDVDATVNRSNRHGDIEKLSVSLINASSGGFLLSSESPFNRDSNLTVDFKIPINKLTVQLIGRVTWATMVDDKWLSGITVVDVLSGGDAVQKFCTAISVLSPICDRRTPDNDSDHFPVRNRHSDLVIGPFKSPYHSFFENLNEISKTTDIHNIVLCKSISYLQKKIRSIFPKPRILFTNELSEKLSGETLLVMNLDCRRKHETYMFLDFEEYLAKGGSKNGPLDTLVSVSRALSDHSKLSIASLGRIHNRLLAQKYLRIAKFHQPVFKNDHVISVERKPLFSDVFGKGRYTIQEIHSRKDIDAVHQFAQSLYHEDHNYQVEIDDLFTNHSDFYVIRDAASGLLVNFARVTFQLPGCPLPCMLATRRGSDYHLEIDRPDEFWGAEFFAPYLKRISMTRTYSELVKRFVSYGQEGLVKIYYTTYINNQSLDFDFLSRYLAFREANCVLNYGTFGGDWNLVYTTLNRFQDNLKLNFRSPSVSSRLVNPFINS